MRADGGARMAGAAVLAASPAAAAAYGAVVAALDAGVGGKGLATLVAAATRGAVLGAAAAAGRALDNGANNEIESDVLGHLEEVLAAVSNAAGFQEKVGLGKAKEWLREQGDDGKRLASRVSRFSKARNVVAHPDVGLVADIHGITPVGSVSVDELVSDAVSSYDSEAMSGGEPHCWYIGDSFAHQGTQTWDVVDPKDRNEALFVERSPSASARSLSQTL